MKADIWLNKTLSTLDSTFEISVLADNSTASLSIKSKGIDEYWDNSEFLADTAYPALRAHLCDGKPLDFDGAEVLTKFERTDLFDLYELMVFADALGWLEDNE